MRASLFANILCTHDRSPQKAARRNSSLSILRATEPIRMHENGRDDRIHDERVANRTVSCSKCAHSHESTGWVEAINDVTENRDTTTNLGLISRHLYVG